MKIVVFMLVVSVVWFLLWLIDPFSIFGYNPDPEPAVVAADTLLEETKWAEPDTFTAAGGVVIASDWISASRPDTLLLFRKSKIDSILDQLAEIDKLLSEIPEQP